MDTRLWIGLALALSSHGYSVDPSFGGKSLHVKPIYEAEEEPANYLAATVGPIYPAPPGGSLYPAPPGGSVYPAPPGESLYPAPPGGSVYPAPSASSLVERFNWRFIDYEWPNEQVRLAALAEGLYVPENNLPVGIEIWQDKLFISVPRWAPGVPATLNVLSLDSAPVQEPKLTPYPDWASNREDDCDALTTTYRIRVDECDRLWVLDSGTVGIGNTTQQVCPYAIHVFDLRTDQRIRKYTLREEDVNEKTFIANIAIDVGQSCDDTFMYASDELGYGLIVYDWLKDDSWRIERGFFLPDPLAGDFNVGGINFQWDLEGIFGMALSPVQRNGFKTLFFHALASNREFSVSTEVLRNKEKKDENYHDFVALSSRGPGGHVTSQTMDPNGILFFNLVDLNAVGCWDSRKPYRRENLQVIAKDDQGLIFPSDVRVDRTSTLWVISDKMPVHLEASLDFTEVNFRIFFAPVQSLVSGTLCDPSVISNKLQHDIPQAIYS